MCTEQEARYFAEIRVNKITFHEVVRDVYKLNKKRRQFGPPPHLCLCRKSIPWRALIVSSKIDK